jgi:putative transposase
VNFDFFISKILRSKQLRFCQIPLIQTGYILRDRVNRIASVRGYTRAVRVDNGTELISQVPDRRAYESEHKLVFSQPGKLTDQAFAGSFNGRLRDE